MAKTLETFSIIQVLLLFQLHLNAGCTVKWRIMDTFDDESTVATADSYLQISCQGHDPSKFLLQLAHRKGHRVFTTNFTEPGTITGATEKTWKVPVSEYLGHSAICICSDEDDAVIKPKILYVLCNDSECSTCASEDNDGQGFCYFDSKRQKHCGEQLDEQLCMWHGHPKLTDFNGLCVVDEKNDVSSVPGLCSLYSSEDSGHGKKRAIMDINDVLKCSEAYAKLKLTLSGQQKFAKQKFAHGQTYFITDDDPGLEFTPEMCKESENGLRCEKWNMKEKRYMNLDGDCNKKWKIQPADVENFDQPMKVKCTFAEQTEGWSVQIIFYVKKIQKLDVILVNVSCTAGEPMCLWKSRPESKAIYTPSENVTNVTCEAHQFSQVCIPQLLNTAVSMITYVQPYPESCTQQVDGLKKSKDKKGGLTMIQIILITAFGTLVGALIILTVLLVLYLLLKHNSKTTGEFVVHKRPATTEDASLDSYIINTNPAFDKTAIPT